MGAVAVGVGVNPSALERCLNFGPVLDAADLQVAVPGDRGEHQGGCRGDDHPAESKSLCDALLAASGALDALGPGPADRLVALVRGSRFVVEQLPGARAPGDVGPIQELEQMPRSGLVKASAVARDGDGGGTFGVRRS